MIKRFQQLSRLLSLGLCVLSAHQARAKIYLDVVEDPLPLVEINAIVPKGAYNSDLKNLAAADILDLILESGTKNRTKQELLDAFAAFGAGMSMRVSAEFSSITVSFPYLENKNYDELFKLIEEAYTQPRFDKVTMDSAKVKLKAQMRSLLDRDMQMLNSFIRDWQFFKSFGIKPTTIEDVDSLTVEEVQSFYLDKIVAAENMWLGVVAPPTVRKDFVARLKKLFAKQGSVDEGQHLKPMIRDRTMKKTHQASKTFLIIDKSGRAQTVFSFNALLEKPIEKSKELDYRFANYLFIGSFLSSKFVDEIRVKKGFAYNVSPFEPKLLGTPSFGFSTNPMTSRSIEAFKTISEMINLYYGKPVEGFKQFPDDSWADRLQSYKYSEIMARSSEIKKLMRRKLVVLGEISDGYYKSEPQKWKLARKNVTSTYKDLYSESMVVAGAVGEAANLESLVKLNFPDYHVVIVPFQDVITEKGVNAPFAHAPTPK